ncbi:MAG: NUDIX hydrolase [Candidatus Saccharibacteria bacterium]
MPWQQKSGLFVYWLMWPGLWVYLHFSQRTRLLVVCDQQVLLVKSWLGDGKWSLPGGGRHRGEDSLTGAQRELAEETTLDVPLKDFQFLANTTANSNGLRFRYDLFVVDLATTAPVQRQRGEIVAIGWFDYRQLSSRQLSQEVQEALEAWFD